MNRLLSTCFLGVLAFGLAGGLMAAENVARDSMKPDPAALTKWQDMRFGLFIHWGPVSLKGTEIGWSRGKQVPVAEYDKLYTRFNPEKFNAEEWAKIAKDAGMKYMVLTAKHHDGFCLWPSKFTDYHIGNSPFKRDVVKELSEACRKEGILFCTYFSICDWHHPDYPLGSPGGKKKKPNPNMPRFYEFVKNQTRELVQNYGPLGILWFDGEWEKPWTREYGNELCRFLRKLQPDLLINNRVSKGRHGMAGTTKDASLHAGDYDTPEQRVGGFNMDRPWETCMTICRQWAWKPNDRMKSLKQCLQTLISTNGGNGNLLFNVGPMPDGRIEPRQVERLKEMGAWLRKYGKTIYGTRGGPYKPGAWGACTRKNKTVYLHIYRFDGDTLKLPPLPSKVLSAKCLTGGEAAFEQTEGSLTVKVPAAQQQEIDTLVALELDRPAMDLDPINNASKRKGR